MSREEMWDLPLESHDGSKRITHWCANLVWVVVGGLFKLLFRTRVDGKDNLLAFKGVSGAVIVCNHTSYLDVACMYLASRPDGWIRIMGRDNLFDKAGGLSGQILARVGAFPVKRDSSDRTAIKRAARHLKNGECVGILPEGTRRGKGSLEPRLHAGAAFIAKMGGGVPIVPMTVRNVEKIKQKGQRLRFPQVTVEFGSPVLLDDFSDMPKDQRLEAATWYAMRECFAMFGSIPADEVDMAALFPKDRDYSEHFSQHPVPRHDAGQVAAAIAARKAARATCERKPSVERLGDERGSADDASATVGAAAVGSTAMRAVEGSSHEASAPSDGHEATSWK